MFYLLIGIVIAVSFNDTFRERLAQNCRGPNDLDRRTRIAATESASFVHADEKLTAFLELEASIRQANGVGASPD